MTTRESAPNGAPCWVDLWTSDVDGSRRFYGELFGWESEDPNPEFGGYFNFLRDGVRIAGAMGDMGNRGDEFFIPANNSWTVYLATDDIHAAAKAAGTAGATISSAPMAVADLGWQARLDDPTGAHLGMWQPGTHPGFTVLDEPGAPSWFELFTRDHAAAVAFYREVFDWETETQSDSDEFRYTTLEGPSDCGQLAGVMDAGGLLPDGAPMLPDGAPSYWSVYWYAQDMAPAVAKVQALGGSVVMPPEDTPYGTLAIVADPAGAEFKLRTPPAA